jgi:23S rRNA pseudouridine955/2504/2580 synthase/23S rRNA pseudouridine1911/1915/1917 synthase
MAKKEWEVSKRESGSKLQPFLKTKLGDHFTARHIKRLIESNLCQVNGYTERFATTVVREGDHVSIRLEETISPSYSFEIDRVLYEDDHLIVYNKPAGISSDEKGIVKILQAVIPQAQLVHRLDRDTTGVLIFAKTAEAFQSLTHLFKEQKVNKSYYALVDGVPKQFSGVIENYLGVRHRYQGQTIWGEVPKGKGAYAYTQWRCVKKGKGASLFLCFPKTGRTHQIRAHLAGIGFPILGDYQYARLQFRSSYQPTRCLLHAYRVIFEHPITKKKIDVTAPLPDDFVEALRVLKIQLKQHRK